MKKSLRIFLMFTMVCSIILQTNNIIRAQEVPSNVITSAKITDASGKPFAEGVTIGPWQAFRIYAEYALPDHMVHAGDTTTMILPIGFGTAAPDHFEIKDGDNLIATGTLYNEKPGKIVLTYTKYAEEHSGTHGSFYFNVNVNGEEQSQSGKIPVTLTVNGKVIPAGEVNYKKPQWVNQPLRKGGWMLNDKTRGKYDIRINESNNVLVNAKLVDTLESPSVEYVEGSIKILQGKWQNLGSTEVLKQQKDVTEKFKSENRIKFEGNRLTIDIGNLPKEVETRGFQILYEVKLNYEPLAGEEIHNKVDLTTDGSDSHQSNFYKIIDAGGVGEGYVYKIKIKKTGKDGAPLAGAEFDVIRVRNKQKVGTIKSGADGTGELGKLLLDDYNLVETKAPAGHMPLKDPILIKSSDFGSNKIAERKIENKKISKIDINGEKTWDDANNQDGKRPDRIRVNLFANQQPIQNVEVRPDVNGKWKYSFKDLPEYDNEGHKITYTITEDTISGYTSKVEGYNIKNSYTPEKTAISVMKKWDDLNDQDGKRPEKIKAQLYADGVKSGPEVELSKDNGWTYTWNNLDKNKNGKPIKYTVDETSVLPSGYIKVVDDSDPNKVVITNSRQVEKINICGKKTWDDNNDQDGKRPTQITVNLLKNGTKFKSVTVKADQDGNWKYEFTNLDKYENKKEIKYTVEEEKVEGYETKVEGYNIKNSYTPEKTEVKGEKTWDDANNQDGKRPTQITVNLLKNGTKFKTVTVKADQDGNWKYEFTNLDKYENKKEIKYTVEEEKVEGYETKVEGYNIKNSYTPEKTEVKGKKTWDDANNQDGKRPTEIKVNLLKNGTKFKTVTVKADQDGNWKYEFTNLDKYENKKEIKYTVEEEKVEGYETKVEGYNIKNSYTPEKTEVKGTKTWNDANNQDGKRPTEIKVNLLKNGTKFKTVTVKADQDGNWKYEFTNLDKYENGQEIKYTVEEEKVEGYTPKVEGYNITNSYTPEKTEVKGTKTWNDANDQDGKRPTEIKVNLLKNGTKFKTVTVKADQDGNWKYEFTNLDKYENGQKIEYTVEEEKVEGYTPKVEGYNITNSYTPEKTELKVTKTWDDENDKDKIRPASITVRLYANDKEVANVVLDKNNNWRYTWKALDKYENGKEIKYTVKEDKVKGYETTIDDKDTKNIIIKNSHKPEKPKKPDTSDHSDIMMQLIMMIGSLLGMVLIARKKMNA